ncbi:MAG: VCBS repeat-containing protein, partial [Planctomycetota bacterium]
LDLIAQVEDELIWVTAPDPLRYSSILDLDTVTAFSAFKRSSGGVDALVVASAAGLEYVIRDAQQLRVFRAVRSTIGGSEWASCRSLATADFDGDGDTDIAGIDAAGQTLLRLNQISEGVFAPGASVALGAEMDELRTLHWTAGSLVLGAILRGETDTACVFDAAGGLLAAEPFDGVIRDLTVVPSAHAAGVDALAVLMGGTVTLLRPGGVIEPAVGLGPIAPTAMSSADVDGDGRADLLLNSSTVDQIVTLLAQERALPGAATFVSPNAATSIVVSLEQNDAAMQGQRANPVGADFDRDGDIDLFQLVESTRTACVQRNAIVNEVEQSPVLVESEWYPIGTGTLAFLHLEPKPLPDGELPDFIEVTLATSAIGSGPDSVEDHRARVLYELGTATTGAGHELVTLQFDGEMGPNGTLLMRGGRRDSTSGAVLSTGVEAAYISGEEAESSARGGEPGRGWERGTAGPQSTPPPPLPAGGS